MNNQNQIFEIILVYLPIIIVVLAILSLIWAIIGIFKARKNAIENMHQRREILKDEVQKNLGKF